MTTYGGIGITFCDHGVIIIPTTRGFATRVSNCHVPSHPSKGITAMSKIGHDSWKLN